MIEITEGDTSMVPQPTLDENPLGRTKAYSGVLGRSSPVLESQMSVGMIAMIAIGKQRAYAFSPHNLLPTPADAR